VVRVLTITNWYPPHHHGGYELSCYDVMTRLVKRGHDVQVLCGDTLLGSPASGAFDADHERRVRRRLRLYHDGAQLLRPTWRERYAIERHNQRELATALDEHRPDVVSVWHMAGVSHGLLATLVRSGVPMVFAICDDWLTYGLRLDAWAGPLGRRRWRWSARALERVLQVPCAIPDYASAGPFLFVTGATEEQARRGARSFPRRRAVVWSGIDRTIFDGPAPEPPPWSWRVIVTGRFDPRKGFETVVRALPLLPPEATVELWGRGGDDERARLEAIAVELEVADRISMGSLEREELPDRYRAADVMVFPSVWPEPFGLVPIEAMACGVPVVATGVGGSAEFLVDGGNCLLTPPGDEVALAAAIERLAGDEGLRGRLVAAGLRTAEAMDVERLADVMEAWHVYEAGGRRGDPPADRPNPGR
jgi:glycosyltransferase involved in cell wall biosynthesis